MTTLIRIIVGVIWAYCLFLPAKIEAANDIVELHLNVKSAPEINGWSTRIEYDKNQVGYVGGSFQPSDFISGLIPLVDDRDGKVSVGGTVLGSDAHNSGDGLLGKLSFEILPGFTGNTDIVVTEVNFRLASGGEDKRIVRIVSSINNQASTDIVGDFNSDGEVDFSDFFVFADFFGSESITHDLDSSGLVDFSDFFLFADNFGIEGPSGTAIVIAVDIPGTVEETMGEVEITGIVEDRATGEVEIVGTVEGEAMGEVEITGTVGDSSTGEIEIIGTVEEQATGEVEITGTVEEEETGEVEIVGTVEEEKTGGASKRTQ
jgi:hypothetical protein